MLPIHWLEPTKFGCLSPANVGGHAAMGGSDQLKSSSEQPGPEAGLEESRARVTEVLTYLDKQLLDLSVRGHRLVGVLAQEEERDDGLEGPVGAAPPSVVEPATHTDEARSQPRSAASPSPQPALPCATAGQPTRPPPSSPFPLFACSPVLHVVVVQVGPIDQVLLAPHHPRWRQA